MTDYAAIAERLEAALGITDAVGVVIDTERAGSKTSATPEASCVHWATAMSTGQRRSTLPTDHAGCSVGSYVHGASTLAQAARAADMAALVAAGWVEPDVLGLLPTLSARPGAIDYVPLAGLDREPQLVLLNLVADQVMMVQAALPALKLTGKPQCQIVPLAYGGQACVSLGCALSRARTGADPAAMTCALPTPDLLEMIDRLEAVAAADRAVAAEVAPMNPARTGDVGDPASAGTDLG